MILLFGFLLLYSEFISQASCLSEDTRVECLPGSDESSCISAGCIWEPALSDAPDCFLPNNYGYRMVGEMYEVENGYAVDLERSSSISMFGSDYPSITVAFLPQTESRLRVKVYTKTEERWEVPVTITGDPEVLDRDYDFEVLNNPVFSFKILRRSTGRVLFDTSLGGLTFSDQFLQIATLLPSTNVYGLGEQEQPTLRHDLNWKTWGMFARDQPPEGDGNLYGVHPHYTVLEEDGSAHGVLFLNSNAQEVVLTPAPGLVYRTIGGILDLYIFLGPTPEAVVSQYTEAVGRYYVPPYWALGFHLCRWGYNSLENMKAAWQRTRDAGIPFDVQWGDIDYMDRNLDFTIGPDQFTELPQFVDELHSVGMKFVPILDPCITTGEPAGSYPPYDDGSRLDIWIKNSSGQPLTAKVWPADYCNFPDFSNPVAQDWWVDQLQTFHDLVPFDGIWIDMNEPANFVAGSVEGCPTNKWNNPPYKPKSSGDTLLEKTICLDAEQQFGRHYDTHSMFGWSQSKPTLKGVQQATGKRGMILSRSTFVGSGKWAAHWLGDNWSDWDNMHFSIIGMLQFNQFGYPLVGADICGFIGNSTEELCARWHQLGAFYPFSRNHNVWDAVDQDPGYWEGGLVARVASKALRIKYKILPYLYSLFYQHTLQGNTVARPVWHEFPTDQETWNIDTQFMLGPAIMVSPILLEGQNSRQVYLPENSVWYDMLSGEQVQSGNINVVSDLMNPEHTTPLHIRGGYIIPIQDPLLMNNTVEQRSSNMFKLIVAMDDFGTTQGDLFLDDGETLNVDNLHTHISFTAASGVMFSVVVVDDYKKANEQSFESAQILGIRDSVTQVVINNDMNVDFIFNAEASQLLINFPSGFSVTEPFIINWF